MENESLQLSGLNLNVNAPTFVPNINAAAFVPTFLARPEPTACEAQTLPPKPAMDTAESSPTTDAPLSTSDASPNNPPVDSWEDEADKEHAEDLKVNKVSEQEINGVGGEGNAILHDNDEDKDVEDPEAESDGEGAADVEAAPKIKKKIVKGPAENKSKKEHINVVFIGHVDAGKSTIGGQIMFLTGMVDKRTLEKYEKEAREKNRESWYLSWALDTNLEEREKGKTVEVGHASFETEKKHFTILDAPGHKSFVPNMISGASQADLAVLVISARKGEFETGFEKGGQTREHAMLAKTAGVKHLVVLINKMDDPTVNWDEERYNECKEKLLPYLKKLGFNPLKDLTFMPCSGLTGAGLKEPVDSKACPWYSGLPFIPLLDEMPPLLRFVDRPFIMPIVDKYKDMGTVVLGKVEAGEARKGQTLLVLPNKTPVVVDQLWSDEDEVTIVGPGENVKIKLKGVEEEDISSGFVLCDPTNTCKTGRIFDAQVVILEHKSIICAGYSAVCHIHTVAEEVSVKALICLVDKKTNEKSKVRPRFVKQDQIAIMRLEAAGVICMEPFKDFPQMGRFTLRDEGRTIAIGKVLKVIE
ncbi:eukaryotic peptide chain release factor GTP-binding subunit ERF3A-like isoform X1 [Daphnia pulicaria]|uniref:eukaryotic peptide chain release factor GTP-binding subunit ERF3A-like isoform X1 n=1 Tax=Daphnia pulicaria TaxID=35523 RepID=UPI001EEC9D5B|nr:eukaryotic peptide chain release factor GTP-binding subunit ERF3A-like isoform X1 [Daphnia pulicaria]